MSLVANPPGQGKADTKVRRGEADDQAVGPSPVSLPDSFELAATNVYRKDNVEKAAKKAAKEKLIEEKKAAAQWVLGERL